MPAGDPSLLLTVINLDGHIGGIRKHSPKLVKNILSVFLKTFPERLPCRSPRGSGLGFRLHKNWEEETAGVELDSPRVGARSVDINCQYLQSLNVFVSRELQGLQS